MVKTKKFIRPKPVLLITLEGLGITPAVAGNFLTETKPHYLLDLISHYPALSLLTHGLMVGTEDKEIRAEQTHQLMGSGRPLISNKQIIDQAIENGTFQTNVAAHVTSIKNGKLHLIALLSSAESEASMSHILALLDWLKNNTPKLPVYVHAIMDGRDTTDKAGKKIISEFEKKLSSHMKIASVMGRMYALDIHGHTSRVQRAVQSLLETEGIQASSAEELLEANYQKKIFDEEITPTIIHQDSTSEFGNIQAGDTVLFCNFEVLSLRALATALVQTTNNVTYLSLSPYNLESITPIFEAPPTSQSLGEIISAANYRQLRIADSDGYAFITAALDGGQEKAWPLEDYRLIQTPALDNYLEALLATQTIITKEVVKNVVEARYDFIALTFSGLDRLGQTGKQAELTTLMRALDNNIEKIVKTVLEHDGVVVIVGSHGLVEKIDLTSETVNHKRTTNPVPFILVGKPFAGLSLGFGEPVSGDFSSLPPAGTLLDVAPTILTLLGLSIPAEMTGKSLFTKEQLF